MGHIHLNVRDLPAAEKFWAEIMGAAVVKVGTAKIMKFPGALIMLRQRESIAGGSEETPVNGISFRAPDIKPIVDRWKAAGLRIQNYEKHRRVTVLTLDDARVTVFEQAGQSEPMVFHGVLFRSQDPAQLMEFYRKLLHVKQPPDAVRLALTIPGARLVFTPSPKPLAETRGHAIDHIGFEIRNLQKTAEKLVEKGIKIDLPYRKLESTGVGTLFITDPAGTTINLTEGLDKL
jgi:catechol 2,3-dioxygenase-like lactoylglutathione lyase family enzyme